MDKELRAMVELSNAMSPFGDDDRAVVQRILAWFNSRYGHATQKAAAVTSTQVEGGIRNSEVGTKRQFNSAAELYDSVGPEAAYEKAVTVGYWLQVCNAQQDFTGLDVNSTLKHMGHGITNITDSFNTAKERKPALVMQTQKSGSSQQARKMYRLTLAGIRWVESRLDGAVATNETEAELA